MSKISLKILKDGFNTFFNKEKLDKDIFSEIQTTVKATDRKSILLNTTTKRIKKEVTEKALRYDLTVSICPLRDDE